MNHSNQNRNEHRNHFQQYRKKLQRLETLTTQTFTSLRAVEGDNSSMKDYSNLKREKEMNQLAKLMNVKSGDLKKMLVKQLEKLPNGSEKKSYIHWLLAGDTDQMSPETVKTSSAVTVAASTSSPKRMISNTTSMDDMTTKKTRNEMPIRPRPIRETSTSKQSNSNNLSEDVQMGEKTFSSADPTLLSSCKFEEVVEIHPNMKKALKNVLKVDVMTDIQAQTFPVAIDGKDILGRARTGTGKTLAFLVPALQRYLMTPGIQSGKEIGILVVSPTRELAIQIGDQADKLIQNFPQLSCHVMYGGAKISRDIRALNNALPTVLVATPGRLIDHLENLVLQNGKKFGYDIMRGTSILVLDETDRLLDMGFRKEIDKIMAYLPKKDKRQTFLFSATVPSDLKGIMSKYMKEDFVEVDCIQKGDSDCDSSSHTNKLVEQTYTVIPSVVVTIEAVVKLILDAIEKDTNHKLIVFFPTARMVGFYADFFNIGLGIEVSEIHSKKSQGSRNKTSAQFRESKTGILFTSDVSARGVDYPDVTTVLQFGLPESKEQYIHRLGRSGRAGKTGKGLLVLAPFEARFVQELSGIDIKKDVDSIKVLETPMDQKLARKIDSTFQRIRSGDKLLSTRADQAYQSFLGYYMSNVKRLDVMDKEELLKIGNKYAEVMGLKEIPGLTKKAAKMMGIIGFPGVKIITVEQVKNKNRNSNRLM